MPTIKTTETKDNTQQPPTANDPRAGDEDNEEEQEPCRKRSKGVVVKQEFKQKSSATPVPSDNAVMPVVVPHVQATPAQAAVPATG